MSPGSMIDMIWDALEGLAKNPHPKRPRPGRMKLEGTVGAPRIVLQVIDPNPPTPDMGSEWWVITTEGVKKTSGSCLCAFGVTCPMHDEVAHG